MGSALVLQLRRDVYVEQHICRAGYKLCFTAYYYCVVVLLEQLKPLFPVR